MAERLAGKTALITGGSRGIGAAAALAGELCRHLAALLLASDDGAFYVGQTAT